MSNSLEVRPARRDDIGALAETLATAFQQDPVMTWLWPEEAKRASALPRFFATLTRHHDFATGGVDVACDPSGGIGGAALWNPPGRWRHSTLSELLMLPRLAQIFGTRLLVGKRLSDATVRVHPKEPHWYLAAIGTDTDHRGGGYGQALIRARLDRCDREQLPAYLESSNHANIGYYERFGFQVTATITTPNGGPSLWAMWREAK